MAPLIVSCAQCGQLIETLKVATARRIAGGHRREHPAHDITVSRKKGAV